MTIYIGNTGKVDFQRSINDTIVEGLVGPTDISTTKNRFSFEFPDGTLVSGDRIQIKTTMQFLFFISQSAWSDNIQRNQGTFFVHVDILGGLYLYNTFQEAIEGSTNGRLTLANTGNSTPITVQVVNSSYRQLGDVVSYEFNTERDSVDVTTLSNSFKEQYSTLISGSGKITCFFDYFARSKSGNITEKAIYMHQLLIRQQIGAEFTAKLYLLSAGTNGALDNRNDSIWYELTGILTNVGISFESSDAVRSEIEFISKGSVLLKFDTAS